MGPRHIAIIMDGNGRWAKNRHLPRTLGHVKGAKVVRPLVKACTERGITHLTLFAFSTENWRRPPEEVSTLMGLFGQYLEKEVSDMQKQGVRFRLIGDRSAFAQGAYTELYFTDALWPDFNAAMLDDALAWYQKRVRRFGRTDEQVLDDKGPSAKPSTHNANAAKAPR